MLCEFQPKEIGPEVVPRLTTEEENSLMSVYHQNEIFPLSEARMNPDIMNCLSVGIIEVTGMPHLRRTTMLKQFQIDCRARGLEIVLHKEQSTIKKSSETMEEYNLGFLYHTQQILFGAGDNPSYQKVQILDRGILGQIPFIESLINSNMFIKYEDYYGNLYKDLIVNSYGPWVDALIICNSDPDRSFLDPNNKLQQDQLHRLSKAYQKLPKTILEYRRKFLSAVPQPFLTTALLIVNLDADVGWNKFKYNFMRSLGSVLNM